MKSDREEHRLVSYAPVSDGCDTSSEHLGTEASPEKQRLSPQYEQKRERSDSSDTYTLEEGLSALGFGAFQWMLFFYVGVAWTGDAMEMMLLSFLSPAAACDMDLTPTQESWITSAVFLGMMVGSYLWGAISDWMGRKKGFFATALVTAAAGLASAISPNYWTLMVFRGIVGFGLGGVPVSYTLFMEMIPSESRGGWLVAIEFYWTIGSILEAGLAWMLLPSLGWRGLLAASAAPLFLLLLFYHFVPESPHFLLLKGRTREAEAVLQRISRRNRKPLPAGRLREREFQPRSVDAEDDQPGCGSRTRQFFKALIDAVGRLFTKDLRTSTVCLIFLWLFIALAYYGLVLLATQLHAGDGRGECIDGDLKISNSSYLEVLITSSGETVGLVIAALVIDRAGRRRSMATFLLLTALLLLPLLPGVDVIGSFTETALLFLSRATIMSAFTMVYVYTPEVYPTDSRSFGLGVTSSLGRIGGLFAPFFSVKLFNETRVGSELLYSFFCILSAVIACMLPIETRGRALLETAQEVEMLQRNPVHDVQSTDVPTGAKPSLVVDEPLPL